MDSSIKKQAAALTAAAVMIFFAAVSAYAAPDAAPTIRPRPGSNGQTTTTTTTTKTTTSGTAAVTDDGEAEDAAKATQAPKAAVVSDSDESTDEDRLAEDNEETTAKTTKTKATLAPMEEAPVTVVETAAPQAENTRKGVSKTAMFIWFLISVIVNGAISFVIANRFYKLSRKESHVTSEIRALRRDVEEKFVGNVGGFAESEVDVENSNEDYSIDEEGIKMTPAYSAKQKSDEADEMFRKWEEDRAKRRAALKRTVETEPEEDFDDDVKVYTKKKKKRYQPKRQVNIEEDEDDAVYEDEEKGSGFDAIKGKTKEFLGDIFPFKED